MEGDAAIEQFISALDDMMIAEEGTLGIFMNNPIDFIENYQFKSGTSKENPDRLGIICLDGHIYCQIMQACNDLIRINAYDSALLLIGKFIDKLEVLKEDSRINDSWKLCIDSSLEELRDYRLKTREKRDDYYSTREAVLAKYNRLLTQIDNDNNSSWK